MRLSASASSRPGELLCHCCICISDPWHHEIYTDGFCQIYIKVAILVVLSTSKKNSGAPWSLSYITILMCICTGQRQAYVPVCSYTGNQVNANEFDYNITNQLVYNQSGVQARLSSGSYTIRPVIE